MIKKCRKIIFLDIDGVLNSRATIAKTPSGLIGVGDIFVKYLSDIVNAAQAEIVLSSSWKYDWEMKRQDGEYLDDKLNTFGIKIIDRTYEDDLFLLRNRSSFSFKLLCGGMNKDSVKLLQENQKIKKERK